MAQQFSVEEIPDDPKVVSLNRDPISTTAMVSGIMIGLKALSQGAAIALGNIASHVFALITVAMVFWVWASMPNPNQLQIVSLSLFGLFILAANVIVRRK